MGVSSVCSPLTLQMFIACRGIPVLVGFLEADYARFRFVIYIYIYEDWSDGRILFSVSLI